MSNMDAVRIGMKVVDSAGEEIGTVDDLKAGDPSAATTDGRQMQNQGLLGDLADAFGEGGKLHPQAAAQLLRVGYIRVDRSGPFSGHGYVAADGIKSVDGDTVLLAIPSGELFG